MSTEPSDLFQNLSTGLLSDSGHQCLEKVLVQYCSTWENAITEHTTSSPLIRAVHPLGIDAANMRRHSKLLSGQLPRILRFYIERLISIIRCH